MATNKYPTKKRGYPFKRQLKRKVRRIIFMVVAVAIVSGINYYNKNYSDSERDQTLKQSTKIDKATYFNPNAVPVTDPKTLHKLTQARNKADAKLWVTVHGRVVKILKDDNSGSHHQKFLIKIDDNFTLLISHNIDLASRVPLANGNSVSVSGLYEWNNRGGVIHWTHHDPKGKKNGGWVSVNGKKYY